MRNITDKEQPILIDGMSYREYKDMVDNPETGKYEQYVAQKCPNSYILGLKIGSMWSRISGLKIPDFDWDAWKDQREEIISEYRSTNNEERLLSLSSYEFGKAAGQKQPIEQFEVRGL